MSSHAIPVIDLTSEDGKKFLANVERLKDVIQGEKTKKVKHLTPEQILENLSLQTFMKEEIYKQFQVKRIQIGVFGRKAGYSFEPIPEPYFRFFIHLGDPEVYYIDNDQEKDRMIPMKNGEGFIVSGFASSSTKVTVYQDPIRIIHNPNIQKEIPRIRPRNYSRTTLVYDLELDVSSFLEDEGDEKEVEVELEEEKEEKEVEVELGEETKE